MDDFDRIEITFFMSTDSSDGSDRSQVSRRAGSYVPIITPTLQQLRTTKDK